MVRIGIVGCNYGRAVHVPAFRHDSRCVVQALAATNAARAAQAASACGIPLSFGNWRDLVEHDQVDAVVIATPPRIQPEIARHALSLGKPVLVEKPMAADEPSALAMLECAEKTGRPAMVDFTFPDILVWREAKRLLDEGAIGALRHVFVTWNVENYATRHRTLGWKSISAEGGGALFNFVSHAFYYLEWFCGSVEGLGAHLSTLPGDSRPGESTVVLSLAFASGASGGLCMSSGSYLGSGHRIEFYGEEGALALLNDGPDYMRGFRLLHGRRPATVLAPVYVDDKLEHAFDDGRVAPASRLAARFLDAIERGNDARPDFSAGYRVQCLLDAARRAHQTGHWTETRRP
ncbi:MAG TPA: Gfo/Idh/MocA family oxidoreductase [Candidatus Binataceae bacterium]|nr:Gfo/Idh/MocA family oxidoreductase [Candidatus Binataceae bacterium]